MSLEHALEQAYNKLICITTIFLNLLVIHSNYNAVVDPNVVSILFGVVERLCTTKLLLRNNTNTLDFINDIAISLDQGEQYLLVQKSISYARF